MDSDSTSLFALSAVVSLQLSPIIPFAACDAAVPPRRFHMQLQRCCRRLVAGAEGKEELE